MPSINVRSWRNSSVSIATPNGGFHPKADLRVRYQVLDFTTRGARRDKAPAHQVITHVPAHGLAPPSPSRPLLLRPIPPPFSGRIAAAIPPPTAVPLIAAAVLAEPSLPALRRLGEGPFATSSTPVEVAAISIVRQTGAAQVGPPQVGDTAKVVVPQVGAAKVGFAQLEAARLQVAAAQVGAA